MDNFYLNLSVYLFEQFLRTQEGDRFAESFEYGRPLKGHGWQPMSYADLVKTIAARIARNAPAGASKAWDGERN